VKARLYVLGGPEVGQVHELDPSLGELRLGRSPECEVPLRHRSVSRVHAHLVCMAGAWRVRDADSRNGLFFASERVAEHALEDGDEFRLGELALRLRLEQESAPAAPEPASAPGAARADDGLALEEPDEIQLEGAAELKIGGVDAIGETLVSPAPAERRAAPPPAPPQHDEADERARVLREILAEKERGGVLASDMSQQPVLVRALLYALALGVAVGLFWLAFQGMLLLRS